MRHVIHPVILCGGTGSRLWPLSTPEIPKQFKALTSDKSMIEETVGRFYSSNDPGLSFTPPLVVGSVKHRQLLAKILPDARQILEPFGRNSGPAVAAASLSYQPKDLILIVPADHSIQDVQAFHRSIAAAAKAAENSAIVTFSIEPTYPATGYGYIQAARAYVQHMPVPVENFVEKPDLATAQSYLDAGNYYWNAGIFLFRADTMLRALDKYAPDVLSGTRAAMPDGKDRIQSLDAEAFAQTPSISIDYAVLEKADNVQTVPVNMAWSDVGGYPALHGLLTEFPSDNHTHGPVLLQNAHGMYVRSEGPRVAVNGVSNLVVVATNDQVVITPMDDAQTVKSMGAGVQSRRHAPGLRPELVDEIRNWLWTTFEVWSEKAWDSERGGFVEQLSMEGEPDLEVTRRVRVQARQIFSFAKAIEMGWPGAEKARELVDLGVDYLNTHVRHPNEGWVHTIDRNGVPLDDRRDLYDHALIILAGTVAFRTTGKHLALKIAENALEFINTHLKDEVHGGWMESSNFELPRRANPHMHLLEALLEYHSTTGSKAALRYTKEIVTLFEAKFFDPARDILIEFFGADWGTTKNDDLITWEPGHHYEWASLLYFFERATNHDTGSWRRRLTRCASYSGVNPQTGFVFNRMKASGSVADKNSRLWQQLERAKYHALHSSTSTEVETEQLFRSIKSGYLNGNRAGCWIDEISETNHPNSTTVPASMLYHLVSSFSVLIGT